MGKAAGRGNEGGGLVFEGEICEKDACVLGGAQWQAAGARRYSLVDT